MSFNGSGTFVINSSGQPVVANTVASATVFNAFTADIATGLSTCITKDGQTTPTNNIPMGGFKITGLGAGTVGTDAVRLSQLQAGTSQLLAVSGTDTLTALGTPTVTAYATGNLFYFVAAATNTTSVTLNVDGLGAKAVTRHGSTALVAGDILTGEVCLVVYDGTRFQLLNPDSYTNLNVSGNLTLNAGTANGVAYLNGSKALTSGSALVFDGTNLGIGTSSPAQRLEVLGASNGAANTYIRVTANIASGYETGLQFFRNGGSIVNAQIAATTEVGNDFGRLTFSTANAGTLTERMRLDSSGNLGIGTATPGTRLHSKSGQAENLRLEGTTARGSGSVFGSFFDPTGRKGYWGFAASVDDTFFISNEMNASLAFQTNAITRATLDSSGNLGIGTSSPTAVLDVNADKMRLRTAKTPSSATDTGNAGDICWDSSYLYICTATNTWRRIAHASW
jgi:hypothetical protein